MRRREGLPWFIGKDRVDEEAIAPAPPVAPEGPSEYPGVVGDASPSGGTLRKNIY